MKRLRAAIAVVTLVGGTATANWLDPETALAVTTEQIQLEYVPDIVWGAVTTPAGTPGTLSYAWTANGVTVTSSSGTDTSTVRVYALCKFADVGIF